jgi:hypothetical protein
MSLRLTLTCLLGWGLLFVPRDLVAQATDSGTTAQSPSDSQAMADSLRRVDTAQAGSSDTAPHTARPDSARADTAKASADTARPSTRDSIHSPAAAEPSPAEDSSQPGDSILTTACLGLEGSGVARDLLVIVFATEAGAGEREAVANSVGGKLVGEVPADPGAYYLHLARGGDESRLRAVADELALLSQVRQVGSRACPSVVAPGKPSS